MNRITYGSWGVAIDGERLELVRAEEIEHAGPEGLYIGYWHLCETCHGLGCDECTELRGQHLTLTCTTIGWSDVDALIAALEAGSRGNATEETVAAAQEWIAPLRQHVREREPARAA